MITQPLEIEKDTIFISGNEKTTDGMANTNFAQIDAMLQAKGYKTFNPFGRLDCKDINARCAYAAMCDKMVTLPDFDRYENSIKEVQVARSLGKEIIAASGFERWEQRKKQALEQEGQ